MPRNKVARQLRKHLLKALEYIITNSDFASLPGDQCKFVSSAYNRLKTTGNDRNWNIEITQFEVPIEDQKLDPHSPTLLMGGIMQVKNGMPTHLSFSVCVTFTTKDNAVECGKIVNAPSCCLPGYLNQKRVVRRFHFDFQPSISPSSHVQYGGIFHENGHVTDCHYCLEHFLENPRIHYPPIDLVLLLDLMIREFETVLKNWRQETNWRSLVLKSQDLWWKDYWNRSAIHINDPRGVTFHERIYGER